MLEDDYEEFESLDNIEKSSYMLGNNNSLKLLKHKAHSVNQIKSGLTSFEAGQTRNCPLIDLLFHCLPATLSDMVACVTECMGDVVSTTYRGRDGGRDGGREGGRERGRERERERVR